MKKIKKIRMELLARASVSKNKHSTFFKTGVGDYAAHDQFMGVSVPAIRELANDYFDLSMDELSSLIASPFNEERLFALIVLVRQYEQADQKSSIYKFYMDNKQYVNNWNLVDASAHLIVGAHLFQAPKTILLTLAESPVLWDRRIAIVSTWYFIRKDSLAWTFTIAKILLKDDQDLIHKAVGWMLREAGKRDVMQLEQFLNTYAHLMPRTMLRYSIEKFDEPQRQHYLAVK